MEAKAFATMETDISQSGLGGRWNYFDASQIKLLILVTLDAHKDFLNSATVQLMIDSIDTTVMWNSLEDIHEVPTSGPSIGGLDPAMVTLFLTQEHRPSSRPKTYADLNFKWTYDLLEPIRAGLYDNQIGGDITVLDLPAGLTFPPLFDRPPSFLPPPAEPWFKIWYMNMHVGSKFQCAYGPELVIEWEHPPKDPHEST